MYSSVRRPGFSMRAFHQPFQERRIRHTLETVVGIRIPYGRPLSFLTRSRAPRSAMLKVQGVGIFRFVPVLEVGQLDL
jgi:hypothetical protein